MQAQREVVLDTETTGVKAQNGDRIVEIGCLELVNHMPTGRTFHAYLNPERDMPAEAERVHGLSSAFLADKPLFAEVADDFLGFIGDAPLIIHNAPFDMGFLNVELAMIGRAPLDAARAIDTLVIARQKFPGAPASLDALCKRFGVDLSTRTLHGALLDSELLAAVYLELIGGRQPQLIAVDADTDLTSWQAPAPASIRRERPAPLPPRVTEEELAAHRAFIETLGEDALWLHHEAGKV